MNAAPVGTFAPFQHRTFRLFWTASLISNIGVLVQTIGASWVMMTISGSAGLVALVQSMNALPVMLFALAAGALADNFDRRLIMLGAQAAMLAFTLLLAAAVYFDWVTPWLLLGLTFLIGTGSAVNSPSWQASIRDTVPRDTISAAVTLNNMGFNVTRSIGPAIGGTIVASLGISLAFLFNAFTYLPILWVLAKWRPDVAKPDLPREGFLSAMSAGLRYVAMSPNILIVLFRTILFSACAVSVLALLPVVARDLLGAGALTYGGLLGTFGLGAILGAFVSGRIRQRMVDETVVRICCLVFLAATVALGLSDQILLSYLVLIPAGACWVITLSLFNISVQLSTPRWVVGRAIALYQMTNFGGLAIGSWLWGALADAQGVSTALVAGGSSLLLCAIAGLRFRVPTVVSVDLDPLGQFEAPATELDIKARSGPIFVMIEYRIRQEDIPDFLRAMTIRRRIRLRDGAQRWALLRHVEEPERWTESYHVPTWLEYIRHNSRRTKADAEVMAQLRRLNQGEPPRVHRWIERQTVPPTEDITLKSATEFH
ncbi:MAG: MFS transporter [Ferrovibrio sp.]|uniref:MFS transporter n=1 Tax=Ferrovibrio sp. TaxID=1917215 RepID=UPI00260F024A|nr:MFS transporter [Ferrovibrio sp.]MCW0236033.1 MFS transporter [Ferrovibrio sp.]